MSRVQVTTFCIGAFVVGALTGWAMRELSFQAIQNEGKVVLVNKPPSKDTKQAMPPAALESELIALVGNHDARTKRPEEVEAAIHMLGFIHSANSRQALLRLLNYQPTAQKQERIAGLSAKPAFPALRALVRHGPIAIDDAISFLAGSTEDEAVTRIVPVAILIKNIDSKSGIEKVTNLITSQGGPGSGPTRFTQCLDFIRVAPIIDSHGNLISSGELSAADQ
ncbi:MAG: hypothetical protein AMXMBFR7_50850 [Planctomycetota bacterium]